MFGTLRYDRDTRHAEFIDRTDCFLGDAAGEHTACDKCRLTKLKCTGQRSGCDRCKVRGAACVYSPMGSRDSRNRRDRASSPDAQNDKQNRRKKTKGLLTPAESRSKSPLASTGPDEAPNETPDKQKERKRAESPSSRQRERHAPQLQDSQPIPRLFGWEPTVDPGWIYEHPGDLDLGVDFQLPLSPYPSLGMPNLESDFFTNSLIDACDTALLNSNGEHGDNSLPRNAEDVLAFLAPSPIPTPDNFSTNFNETSYTSSVATAHPNVCSCLTTIVAMLDDLEIPHSALDDLLASLKTRIGQAETVLCCTRCHSRGDHIALVIHVCDRLVKRADHIVRCYLQRQEVTATTTTANQSAVSTPGTSSPCALPPSPAASPSEFLAHGSIGTTPASPTSAAPTAMSNMFFGRYKTDAFEWECLMRVLIGMQLQELGSLLAGVRLSSFAPATMSSGQISRLDVAQAQVESLAGQLAGGLVDGGIETGAGRAL